MNNAYIFSVKDLLIEYSWPDVYVTIVPALISILSVNVIIVFYVISAFKSEKLEKQAKLD